MENLNTCLVCGNKEFTEFLNCKDYVATDEMFSIQRCTSCSFLFTNPRPTKEESGRYYKSDNYMSHANNKTGLIYTLYDIVRNYSIKYKIALIKRFHQKGKLMDLGCGLGDFLNGVNKDGTYSAIGVDISDDAIAHVKSRFGLSVYNESALSSFDESSFDVITQWHVLEHVLLLNERMAQLKRLLKPDGTLFIAVPNSDSWDAKYYNKYWDAYDVPRHLYHFNQKSFNLLMEKSGFKVTETHPMFFDAPYVSMRSEIHKGSVGAVIKGAVSGIRSTISAQKGNNYSSLLFVVKNA
jgi:2-polyprenyl-3-methyl-5-hydroxy-6-metoxy-1,4-benzoquinol methylase